MEHGREYLVLLGGHVYGTVAISNGCKPPGLADDGKLSAVREQRADLRGCKMRLQSIERGLVAKRGRLIGNLAQRQAAVGMPRLTAAVEAAFLWGEVVAVLRVDQHASIDELVEQATSLCINIFIDMVGNLPRGVARPTLLSNVTEPAQSVRPPLSC